jgi:hypothetical protein
VTRKVFLVVLIVLSILSFPTVVLAGDLVLENALTFYGDVEGFTGPYRQGLTLLGQEFESFFEISKGNHTLLEAGFFADGLEQQNIQFNVNPVLSFKYYTDTTRLILGTLENENRHGYLEPLEDPLLEFTRPIEYGLQWKEKADGFQSDWFLDWQFLNVVNQPEVFDYGGVTKVDVDEHFSLEAQFHGYHEGGRIYFVLVFNNYVPAIGFRLHGPLPILGQSSLAVFGVISCDFVGQYVTGPDWGNGLYVRAGVTPWGLCELYGIMWNAQNFFSQEGDPNYNSQGLDPNYYQTNRTYEEVGLKKTIADNKGFLFDAEIKSEWADATWALSGKLVATMPFNLDIPIREKKKDGVVNANE